jgi:hypothetical protein
MGGFIIGAEGAGVWYIYASPISPKSLVKAKYSFVTLFSFAITLLCFVIAVFLTFPTLEIIVVGLVESILLVASLAMVSLTFGIKGADFRELPRPRMIRPLWSFVNVLVCFLLGVTILSPMIPYGLKILFDVALPESYLYIALPLSAVIASAVTYVFHRTALNNVEEFLLRAEV